VAFEREEFRETRKEKRKIWRADTARKLRLQLNAFGTWVAVRDESAELHRIAAAFFTAFLGWRHVTRTRAALRNSLKQRGVRRLAELAVRAWRGWRRRTALTAAADAMRLRSLAAVHATAFHGVAHRVAGEVSRVGS
jgi:hypothetical protein